MNYAMVLINVGNRKQLFLDDLYAASADSIDLKVNPPVQADLSRGPVIRCWCLL